MNKRIRRLLSASVFVGLVVVFFMLDFKNEETYLNNKFDEPILNVDKYNNDLNQEAINQLSDVESIKKIGSDGAYVGRLPQLDEPSKTKAQREAEINIQKQKANPILNSPLDSEKDANRLPVVEQEPKSSRKDGGLTNEALKIPVLEEQFPMDSDKLHKFVSQHSVKLPQIQFEFNKKTANEQYLQEIKASFLANWNLYSKKARYFDEIQPISERPINSFTGWSVTLIDALDTLYIMGLETEFKEAVGLVSKIDFDQYILTEIIPIFETVIRLLGGLISAYELSNEPILLEKAIQLGDLLMYTFDTPNRMPRLYFNWKSQNFRKSFASQKVSLAELGTLSLEFTKLAQLTGDNKYSDPIQRIFDDLASVQKTAKIPGLVPIHLDASGCRLVTEAEVVDNKGDVSKFTKVVHDKKVMYCDEQHIVPFSEHQVEEYTLGGLSDSFYEYLIKQHVLFPNQVLSTTGESLLSMYSSAAKAIKRYLLFKPQVPNNEEILFSGDIIYRYTGEKESDAENIYFKGKHNHLNCFAGGMFAIGAKIMDSAEDLEIASNLTKGCLYLSDQFGLMPESIYVDYCDDWKTCPYDENKRISWIRSHTESGSEKPQTPEKKIELNVSHKFKTYDVPIPYAPLTIDDKGRTIWKVGQTSDQPLWANKMEPTYFLRPELIESVFVMYRVTGDLYYRERGWKYFQDLVHKCEVADKPGILTSINDVSLKDKTHDNYFKDNQESFLFSETYKYLYLLFTEEDVVSLDEYVFNTEAHPFKRL